MKWMAFSMPVYNVFRQLLLITVMLGLTALPARADTIFSINHPRVEQIGNGYVLNAEILYPLTPRVIEALENGVPITFFQEFELFHSVPVLGDFWDWETTKWRARLNYELRYHALSEQYVVFSLDTHEQLSFQSLDEALRTLGHIKGFSLPPKDTADITGLKLRLRSGLDLNALPTPMRPGALISSKWQLNSPWVEAKWQ